MPRMPRLPVIAVILAAVSCVCGCHWVGQAGECADDSDCEKSQYCDNFRCAWGCNEDSDCEDDEHWCRDNVCRFICVYDEECANGAHCDGGMCVRDDLPDADIQFEDIEQSQDLAVEDLSMW